MQMSRTSLFQGTQVQEPWVQNVCSVRGKEASCVAVSDQEEKEAREVMEAILCMSYKPL